MGRFARDTILTFAAQILGFVAAIGTSIIIARVLGPDGKGVYSLALLLPSLITTLLNLGIAPATVYYIGKGKYSPDEMFGSNLVFAGLISGFGILSASLIIIFLRSLFLKGVPVLYLFIATGSIPAFLLTAYLRGVLLGLQDIKGYNLVSIVQESSFLALVVLILLVFKSGTSEAIIARIASLLLGVFLTFGWCWVRAGKPSYRPGKDYIRDLSSYGIKAHIGNITAYLNHRIDMLLVGAFLNPLAVGYYSIAVTTAQKLWLITQSAGIVLFPRVASEKDEKRRKEFTPVVSRNALVITALVALPVSLLSKWIIPFLYSEAYLPSVRPLQILLPGVIALSAGSILAQDIAGRGKPILNSYMGAIALVLNICLNILWIPRFGIQGAALATMVSYIANLLGKLLIYCRISGNPVSKVMILQRGDIKLYRKFAISMFKRLRPAS